MLLLKFGHAMENLFSAIIHIISTFQMVQLISKQLQQASNIETNNSLWLQAIKTREW